MLWHCMQGSVVICPHIQRHGCRLWLAHQLWPMRSLFLLYVYGSMSQDSQKITVLKAFKRCLSKPCTMSTAIQRSFKRLEVFKQTWWKNDVNEGKWDEISVKNAKLKFIFPGIVLKLEQTLFAISNSPFSFFPLYFKIQVTCDRI